MELDARLREGPLKVRDVWSEEKTSALSARVVRLRRRRSLTRGSLLLGAVACGALASLLWSRDAGSATPLPRASEAPVVAAVAPATPNTPNTPSTPITPKQQAAILLRDGSRAEPTSAESRFTVSRDQPEQVTVVLERGGARFAVARRAERRFEVEAGPALVRVKGTTFSVTRSDASTRVVVEDGRVEVFWGGEKTELLAGDTGVFPPPEPALEAQAHEVPAAVVPGWRDLAKRGEYRRAFAAMQKARARVPDAPEDHMLAADVARLSGHSAQAVSHLRAVSERFADDPRAPVAAFTLGRVLQDLERPREAAQAFRRARTLWPRGPLALDAWAGEAEALREAGDRPAAQELATRYIERHPFGRHARAMRGLAGLD